MTKEKNTANVNDESLSENAEIKEEIFQESPEKVTEETAAVEEVSVKADPEEIDEPEMDAEDESLTLIEKFVRFETETKAGLISALIILIALVFRWDWINTSWWLILIIGAIGVKTLYTQMNDLKEEKPLEAKISRIAFISLMVMLVIRDLYITSRLDDFLDIISR